MAGTLTPPVPDSPTSRPWTGRADLVFERHQNQTRRVKTHTQAPLRVLRSHYPEGPSRCYTTLVHTAGGMVGGDQLHQRVQLRPHSQAFVTTPAASKVYRSTGETSIQSTHIQVGAQACLEWFPQETIVFEGANYHHTFRVELDSDAWILLWDITRFGRSAMGEEFGRGRWRADLEVWQAGLPLWIDRQAFSGDSNTLPHSLFGFPVVGTLALVGRDLEDSAFEALRHQLAAAQIPIQHVGLTRNLKGFVCRYRGPSSQAARRCFCSLWQQLRQVWFGEVPPVPRIWI